MKFKNFTYTFFVFMLTVNIGSAIAAEPEIHQKDEIVVTATRTNQEQKETPGTTEVISKEEIIVSGSETAAEVLEKKGLVVSTNGGAANVATVQLDGFSAGQT
jgi:outer membrane cobalamin receptor